MRRYRAAVYERNIQVEGHRGFTATLSEELVERWEELCVAWERDCFPKQSENPYTTDGICKSYVVPFHTKWLISLLRPD